MISPLKVYIYKRTKFAQSILPWRNDYGYLVWDSGSIRQVRASGTWTAIVLISMMNKNLESIIDQIKAEINEN